MSKLRFTKMHGLGNDFMVLDLINQSHELKPAEISSWADRHMGIGFDQLLVVSTASSEDVDFQYRIFNADGSEVEQCGNGARCFARFVLDQKLSDKNPIVVKTNSGVISLAVKDNGEVTVDMGAPIFEPADIPLNASARAEFYEFTVNEDVFKLQAVSMGNPHGVLKVDSVDTAPVETLGPCLEIHPNFPNRANIGFMEVVDRHQLRLRVFERGVGETKACGTGACAAAVAAIQQQWVDSPVKVSLPGGTLNIEWAGEGHPVLMTGPATSVFEGTITV
ncbi:MAG: diaminopimelate epimerase [Pseudomonadales bacterium]|nr:diaminopimelate epimerase [Pseudomonadales bacterium]